MTGLAYRETIAASSTRFRDLLASADPQAVVASCPDWSVDDLLWHLAEVQWFWATIVADRLDSPKDAEATKPNRPTSHDGLVDLATTATDRLLAALDDVADDEPVWSWSPDGNGAWVHRRQAHEALIHRVDAELVAGEESHLDPDMATDGIDEVLCQMFGQVPSWGDFLGDDRRLVVAATDTGRGWDLELGRFAGTSPRSGKAHDWPAVRVIGDPAQVDLGDAATTISGPAADLDLWLWLRTGEDRLDLGGDQSTLDAFRHLVHDGIQ